MITKDNHATEQFVKAVLAKTEGALKRRIEDVRRSADSGISRLDNEINKLRQEIRKNHNVMMTKLDSIANIMKKTDEEQTLTSYQVSQHLDRLDNHEERIRKLEKPTL